MSVFVSHDGDGTEVYVATAKGKVTQLDEKANAINVKIEAPYLDYPLNGWLNKDEEILTAIRKAHEDGTEHEVRIESQRKKGLDRSTPIQELREKDANKNIIKKLVAFDGAFTGEALTNPEEDPATGQATSALNKPARNNTGGTSTGGSTSVNKEDVLATLKSLATAREVSESVLDAVKAQALISGATAAEVIAASTLADEEPNAVQAGFSKEAPGFKEYNSDGRLNLGGPSVSAGVGVYNSVYERLNKQLGKEPNAETVEFLAHLLLSIADRIQVGAYGTGSPIDRTAGSHTRVRASIYTLLDAGVALPINTDGTIASKEAVNDFVQYVGKTARHNFLAGIKVSQQNVSVNALLASLDKSAVADAAPVNTVPDVAPEAPQSAVEESQVTVTSGIVAPASEEEVATPAAATVSSPVSAPEPVNVVDGTEWFPQQLLPPGAINASNAPSEETLEEFKNFVVEEAKLQSKAEQAQVAKLLAHTFGKSYSKASNVPDEHLGDFLDFYVASGVENFKAVLASF